MKTDSAAWDFDYVARSQLGEWRCTECLNRPHASVTFWPSPVAWRFALPAVEVATEFTSVLRWSGPPIDRIVVFVAGFSTITAGPVPNLEVQLQPGPSVGNVQSVLLASNTKNLSTFAADPFWLRARGLPTPEWGLWARIVGPAARATGVYFSVLADLSQCCEPGAFG